MQHNSSLILYDGHCLLCSRVVQFILIHEKNKDLSFAPLTSVYANNILKKHKVDSELINTVVFIYEDAICVKSNAVFRIASYLKMPYRILGFLNFLPRVITDYIYDLIANSRYKIFKKQRSCFIPTDENKNRFLK